jgi:hypothetical protein
MKRTAPDVLRVCSIGYPDRAFLAAGHHEIGTLGVQMCRYGSTFCDNPFYVLVGAALAAVWGAFVSIR